MSVLLFITGAVVIVACAAALNVYMQQRKQRCRMAVCPECGAASDSFVSTNESTELEGLPHDDDVCCGNVVSLSPFEECSFTVPRWQLEVPWLRFAGVGGTCNAGQTVWNAACSSRLRPFLTTEQVSLEPLPSGMQEHLQRSWCSIQENKSFPTATHIHLPEPWCLAVRPRTRHSLRRIVAVSDFAGEIPNWQTLEDHLYRILLDKDGYFFFIDLERLTEEKSQLEVFHRFLVNLRANRGLRNRDSRLSPIAVCISKLDFLPECVDGPENTARADRCIQDIQDSGPADEATTLSAIRRRHELILKHSSLVPCVKSLNGRLQDECGKDGFMFFPMTSVGWVGSDLSTATAIRPYGVIDPLLWLLHASGMKALPP